MNSFSISRLIFETVPQLYEAKDGPYHVEIPVPGEETRVYSMLPISDPLKKYLERTVEIWEDLRPMTEGEISQVIEREWIQQKFVIAWLEARTQVTTWSAILDYARRLGRRFTENQTLSKTIVIETEHAPLEATKLTDPRYLKVIDWLGTSPLTYFRVDEDLGIKSLEAISMTDVKELEAYRFYPDFLHPVISGLRDSNSVVLHLSANGSILIADRNGLIASKRALESWTIYDVDHILASVAEVMKRQLQDTPSPSDPGCVACSLFQVLFDISMKRHGGLLVVDHPRNLDRYLIKGIERGEGSPLNTIFTHSPFNGLEFSIPEVRKLVELSSVDGALILDLLGNLVQVGSMVMSHPAMLNQFGTREAAAYSAAKYGATSFKISANGDFKIFFTTPELTGDDVHRFDFH